MGKFEINILGCGSALPTLRHYPSTQVLNIRDNLFMIDCGEGAQIQFRRMRLKFNRLGHIFLSHLHGDHCFGLIGMISTLSLLGRTGELVVHAHPQAEAVFRPQLDFFCRELPFAVRFEPVLPGRSEVIYEDHAIRVRSLADDSPGALFGIFSSRRSRGCVICGAIWSNSTTYPSTGGPKSKPGLTIPLPTGRLFPNDRLTTPAEAPLRYAYCFRYRLQ